MGSRDYPLNSHDRSLARRSLDMHLENGNLTQREYENRKLLLVVADNVEDLEKVFQDLDELPEITRPRLAFPRARGRRLGHLDIVCLVIFVVLLCVAQFVLRVEWTMFLLCIIFFIPLIPRAVIELDREEELLYYESGIKKK